MSAYAICGETAGVAAMLATDAQDRPRQFPAWGTKSTPLLPWLSGVSLFGGRGSVVNVLFGALIIATIRSQNDLAR